MLDTITIGFSRPRRRFFPIMAYLVRWYQKTPYSHVYMSFYSESINRTLIYEAVGEGVRFVSPKIWANHAEEVKSYTIQVKRCNAVTLLQYCVDHAGEDYGFMQNVGVLVSKWFKLRSNPWPKGKNCSEAMAELLKAEGYVLPKEPNLMTPKDIDLLLSKTE